MSINTKSKTRWLAKHWKKFVILFLAIFLSGSPPFLAFYLGFWVARWTYGLKIHVSRKTSQNGVKTTDTEVQVEFEETEK